MNNFDVYTMTDKADRDDRYNRLRKSDDALERQVVKFSGAEIVLDNEGKPEYTVSASGEIKLKYRTTWSYAIPSGRG